MSDDFSQFRDAFFEEAAEHLQTMEEGLLQLEQSPGDLDLLNRIFRSAHSIKGGAGMFGLTAVTEFTHKVEGLLDKLRNGDLVVTEAMMNVLLQATDGMKTLVEAAQTGQAADDQRIAELREQVEAVSGGAGGPGPAQAKKEPAPTPSPAAPSRPTRYAVSWRPPAWLFQRGLDPSRLLAQAAELGALTGLVCDESRLPDLTALEPESCYLGWNFSLETSRPLSDIEAVFDFARDGDDLTIQPVGSGPPGETGAPEPAPQELENAARAVGEVIQELEPEPPSVQAEGHMLLGEILVEQGTITEAQLREALKKRKPIGQVLVEEHVVSPQQIEKALEKQRTQDNAAAAAKKAEAASIRVETGKIDRVINLVGELVITQSMLSSLGAQFEMAKLPVLLERMAQLEANTRELQERVMAIRMLPIGNAFNRFPRLVRDLAGKNGKKIQLVMSGEETELDKTVSESIGDPLTHLVRNSADHGLEPPDERVKAGKPEQGVIRLNAFHEGGNVCITVEDDGRGLNRDKILAKAIKQGLISEQDKLADDQIWALIFRPGFSTADKVTDISGRGVGMDVVKRNIESLGGTVSIKTAPGRGTTFTLKLPLTLAIIDGMTVRVGKEAYIVPLLSILESIQPKADGIKSVVGKGELITVRDACIPVVRLYEVFGNEPDFTDPKKAILLIMETEGEQVAVMVDEILGQQQVVIKSMEQNFRKVEGIAGATILGDGTVGFILDVRGLLALARQGVPVAA